MLVSELCPSKYLITDAHFEEIQWVISKEVPLTHFASIAGGLVLVTNERQMWYEDTDGHDTSLWMTRFYVRGDENPFFWFSKGNNRIGNLEIQHLNENLIKRIGEIKWKKIEWTTLEK
jgi:hypothetical protein